MKARIKYLSYTLKDPTTERVTDPAILHSTVKHDFSPIYEDMYLLVTDIKNTVIDKYLIARGGHNQLLVTPADIFHRVLRTTGTSFAIVHNHPSGDLEPSSEDIVFTKRIKKAADILGLRFLDHLIINSNDYYSFVKHGIL